MKEGASCCHSKSLALNRCGSEESGGGASVTSHVVYYTCTTHVLTWNIRTGIAPSANASLLDTLSCARDGPAVPPIISIYP